MVTPLSTTKKDMPSKRQTIIEILTQFELRKIRYAVIRNYHFLSENKEYLSKDFDIMLDSNYLKEANEILYSIGNNAHRFIHLHLDYIKEFRIAYMGPEILNRTVRRYGVTTFSNEDTIVNIITHAVLYKNYIKNSYRNMLTKYLDDNALDYAYLNKAFEKIFCNVYARKIMSFLDRRDFDGLLGLRTRLLFKFVTKDHKSMGAYLPCFLRNIVRDILTYFTKFRRANLIAIVGVDGSGKTTVSGIIKDFFEEHLGQKGEVIYMGRGRNRALPGARAIVKRIGINLPYPDDIKHENCFKKRLFYFGRDITYLCDSFVRYLFFIYPRIQTRINIITDRYAYDIMLNEETFALTKWVIMNLYPKPNLLIYLYNSPDLLFERKKEHGIKKLSRHMKILESIVDEIGKKKVKILKVKTDDLGSTSKVILENIL